MRNLEIVITCEVYVGQALSIGIMKNCVSLMIGRGGSSLKDKNILMVLGRPLLQYPALAAQNSKYVDSCYISSDCDKILSAAKEVGFKKIHRPKSLSEPDSQSSDVVFHALKHIQEEIPIDYLVVQHANVGTINEEMIDTCLETLFADESLSAVVPAHYENENHPYRASFINQDGTLEAVSAGLPGGVSGNRQDLPECVFFDHSFWAINLMHIRKNGLGNGPWPCMGKRIKPYITEGSFDVHSIDDLKRTEEWLLRHGAVDLSRKNDEYNM